ncbi:hypothetical protein MBLNU13_g09088t2 [Cladosporium sp. NU13]
MAEEGSLPIGGSTVAQLQSQEQAGLLDAIDQLRRENIDADIELVLRRTPADAVFASILPSQRKTAKQRSMISEFQFWPKKLDRNELTYLYSAASVHLEDVDRGPGFRYDTLRIEVSGPTQPHLTLIDLPGLIMTTTGRQSPGAVGAIHNLTRSYLQKPRTIVLAVVSATSDFQVQSIGDLMRDPEVAQRMMGYLGEIKCSMYQITSAASDGIYDDPNISSFFGKGDFNKLRNLINMRSDHLNRSIRNTGKAFVVMRDVVDFEHTADVAVFKSAIPIFQPPYYSSRPDEGPYSITVDSYCDSLSAAMARNRGNNLPDLPNYRDIQAVFLFSMSRCRNEQIPPSPDSSSNSGFQSAKSNSDTNTSLSSLGSGSPEQHHNKATGPIAYKPVSRKKKPSASTFSDREQSLFLAYTLQVVSQSETERLFRKAIGHVNKLQSTSGYWYDTLRIEISGPSQLPLTLVMGVALDLPALYRTKTNDRSSEDVAAILKLAQGYLYKPRTITLAVVNARWDSEHQLTRDIINSELGIHKRTLGVTTGPEDILEKADDLRVHLLARNDDPELKHGLGWHVIKKPQHGH